MGGDRLGKDTEYYIQFDHIVPANNSTTATLQHESGILRKVRSCSSPISAAVSATS